MEINGSNLQALFIDIAMAFKDAMDGTPTPIVDAVAATTTSKSTDTRYPFVQAIQGAMRQWTGARQVNNVVVDGFTVTNLKWENTLGIKREDIEDDQYGVYSDMLAPQLGRHAKLLPDQQVASIFNSNPICYDGKNLFNQNHYINPQSKTGAQSNDLGTASMALNGTTLALANAALRKLVGPDNIALGSYGSVLFVPPSLEYVADTLANSTFYPEIKNGVSAAFGSQGNVFKGRYTVVCSEWLTDTGDPSTAAWYLVDARSTIRPVLWQSRVAPQLVQLVDPSNPVVFQQDEFQMGTRARGAAAAGFWFKAIRANHTAST